MATEQPDARSHGTPSRYNRGCRCIECRRGNAARHKKLRAERKKRRSKASYEHGPSGYENWGCRCKVCTTERTKANAAAGKKYRGANREKLIQRTDARRLPIQRKTLEGARRNGFQWTGPELELIARPDLTAEQAATMLGRTYFAVLTMRRRLRIEPKLVNLAGMSHEAQQDFDSGAS